MKSNKHRSYLYILSDYNEIKKGNNNFFSIGIENENFYEWNVTIFGQQNTLYENGIFHGKLIFPLNYPENPPQFIFQSKMWHPNIEKNGKVCISILHESGEDIYGYEKAHERWNPVYKPESILIAIISLLDDPNCESPANVDAAREYLKDRCAYEERVRDLTLRSLDE